MADSKKNKSFDRSDLISVLAVILSIGAFLVSLYETSLLKEQQQIMFSEQLMMQQQQKANVWPYLEADIAYQYSSGKTIIELSVKNKGVGPAKIGDAGILVKDSISSDYVVLWSYIMENLPEATANQILNKTASLKQNVNFSMSQPSGVLSSEEEVIWIYIEFPRFENDIQFWNEHSLKYQICYCSIYNDCWQLKYTEKEPQEGCE